MRYQENYGQISRCILQPFFPSLRTVVELSRSYFQRYRENIIILSQFHTESVKTSKHQHENRYCYAMKIFLLVQIYIKKNIVKQHKTIMSQQERIKHNHIIIVVGRNEVLK